MSSLSISDRVQFFNEQVQDFERYLTPSHQARTIDDISFLENSYEKIAKQFNTLKAELKKAPVQHFATLAILQSKMSLLTAKKDLIRQQTFVDFTGGTLDITADWIFNELIDLSTKVQKVYRDTQGPLSQSQSTQIVQQCNNTPLYFLAPHVADRANAYMNSVRSNARTFTRND